MDRNKIVSGEIYLDKNNGKPCTPYTGYDYGAIAKDIEIAMIHQGNDEKPDHPSFLGVGFEDLESYTLKPKDMLTDKHIKDVCKPGRGKESCRYLCASSEGFECARISGDTSVAWRMDDRVREGKASAQSINCGGRYGSSSSSREKSKQVFRL